MNNNDGDYVATRLHFENLRQRYGKRIIIMNLLKVGFSNFLGQVKSSLSWIAGILSVCIFADL